MVQIQWPCQGDGGPAAIQTAWIFGPVDINSHGVAPKDNDYQTRADAMLTIMIIFIHWSDKNQ